MASAKPHTGDTAKHLVRNGGLQAPRNIEESEPNEQRAGYEAHGLPVETKEAVHLLRVGIPFVLWSVIQGIFWVRACREEVLCRMRAYRPCPRARLRRGQLDIHAIIAWYAMDARTTVSLDDALIWLT